MLFCVGTCAGLGQMFGVLAKSSALQVKRANPKYICLPEIVTRRDAKETIALPDSEEPCVSRSRWINPADRNGLVWGDQACQVKKVKKMRCPSEILTICWSPRGQVISLLHSFEISTWVMKPKSVNQGLRRAL